MSNDIDRDETLPATTDNGLPALALDGLADRRMTVANITDVLPEPAFVGMGGLANTLSDEQIRELEAPLEDDDIEIRPEGFIYATHAYYRKKLNKVFGPLSWTLRPMSPLKNRLDKTSSDESEWYRVWALYIHGCFVAVAMDSYTLREKNKRMNLSDVDESIHSGSLKRTCKDFLAPELYDRRWRQGKLRDLGVQVVVKTWKGNEVQWRRKDSDPLDGEIGPYTEEKQPQRSTQPAPGGREPEQASTSPAPSAKVAGGAADGAGRAVESPKASEPKASPPAPPAAPAPTGKGPFISTGQQNLVLARARAAGLFVENDPAMLLDILDRAGLELIESPGHRLWRTRSRPSRPSP